MTTEVPDRASEDCRAVSSVLARVGDKWSVLIIVLLGDGPKRFNEMALVTIDATRRSTRSATSADNYLIDVKFGVIMDIQASRAICQARSARRTR